MSNAEVGIPNPGSKDHYILDIENADFSKEVIDFWNPLHQFPKNERKKTENKSAAL